MFKKLRKKYKNFPFFGLTIAVLLLLCMIIILGLLSTAIELPNNMEETGVFNMSGNFLLYHFNNITSPPDNSTLVYDYSGNNNNGTTSGFDGDEIVTGKYGKAFKLQQNDYVKTNKNFTLLPNGTIVAWINFTTWASTSDYAIVANYDGGAFSNGEFLIYLNNDLDLEALMSTTGVAQTSYNGFNDSQFHHIAVTWKANEVKLYIDGILKATDTTFSSSIFGFTREVLVGRDNDAAASPTANRPFNGTIDDVAFFNRTLSGTEVASIVANDAVKPTVVINLPANNSVYTHYNFENFSVNATDSSDLGSIDYYMNFRGNNTWRIESTNGTDVSSPVTYSYLFNFTDWYDSFFELGPDNFTQSNGRSLKGNLTHFFMTSYNNDEGRHYFWNGTYTGQNFSIPPSFMADFDSNMTRLAMIELGDNELHLGYDNFSIISTCSLNTLRTGTSARSVAFDKDNITVWVTFDTNPEYVFHTNFSCANLQNWTLPTPSTPSESDISQDNMLYVHDAFTSPDQIIILNLSDGTNPMNITNFRGRIVEVDEPKGLYIQQNDTYTERIWTTDTGPDTITAIERRLSGSMLWNAYVCDVYSNCAWNTNNYTYRFRESPYVDTQIPNVSTVLLLNKTNETFTISWITINQSGNIYLSTNYTIRWGTTLALANTLYNTSFSTNNSWNNTGLQPNTTYYFNISVCTIIGYCNNNSANEGVYNVTTSANYVDLIPPSIYNHSITNTTNTTATGSYNTSENANQTINFGNTTTLGILLKNTSFFTVALFNFSGLQPNTTYYYNLTVCDIFGNCNTTGPHSFVTSENPSVAGMTENFLLYVSFMSIIIIGFFLFLSLKLNNEHLIIKILCLITTLILSALFSNLSLIIAEDLGTTNIKNNLGTAYTVVLWIYLAIMAYVIIYSIVVLIKMWMGAYDGKKEAGTKL